MVTYIEQGSKARARLIDRIDLVVYIELGSIARARLIDRIRLGGIY